MGVAQEEGGKGGVSERCAGPSTVAHGKSSDTVENQQNPVSLSSAASDHKAPVLMAQQSRSGFRVTEAFSLVLRGSA